MSEDSHANIEKEESLNNEENENEESEAFDSNQSIEEKKEEKGEKNNNDYIGKNTEKLESKFPFFKSNSDEKSIFSQITENLYEKYLNRDLNNKLDIYTELTDNDYLNYHNKPKINKKLSEKKYNDMMERQKMFEENRLNKLKEKKEQQNLEFKRNYTFKPNGKNIEMRDPKIFYEDQQRFIENKLNYIERMNKNKEKKEEDINSVKLISKNSEQIIQKKNLNETKEETLKRLMNGKTIFSKTPNTENKNEKKIKKSMKELTEYSNKLFLQDQKLKKEREEKKKEIEDEMEKEMNKIDLLSSSTKKVILKKFISNFEKILSEMYNEKENIEINEEEYFQLLEKLKCISNNNKNENLVKLSFNKYLNPNNNKINSNQFIIFALSFLGIYKGKDEIKEEEKNKNNKIISSTSFIKSNIPEFDFDKYNYSNKTTKLIKKKFLPFSSKMLEGWNEEKTRKRLEKNKKKEENEEKNEKKKEKRSKSNFYLTLNNNIIKKEILLENLRKKKEEEEMKYCTFQPNISSHPINIKDIKSKVEKLYTDGKISYMKKLKKKENDNNELEKYSFMPKIHTLNLNIFEQNPLENDQRYLDEMIRLEKIRNTRFSNLNNNNENLIPMRFDMEYKTNRDTFNVFNKKKNYKNRDYDEFNLSKDSDIKNGVSPLLKVEVNIDDSNNIVKLVIYPGDDPMKIAEEFCEKYNLGEDKKNKLQAIIQEKLRENDNLSQ